MEALPLRRPDRYCREASIADPWVRVTIHNSVKWPPRMNPDERDIILFSQERVEIAPGSKKLIPTDVKIYWRSFHRYDIVFPLRGTVAFNTNSIIEWVPSNTFDEDISSYIFMRNTSKNLVVIEAGEPFARVVLDCAPNNDDRQVQHDDLAKRAAELGPDVYKNLPFCPVTTSDLPLFNFRKMLMPSFNHFQMLYQPEWFIREKILNMKLHCVEGMSHSPVWVAPSDMVLFLQSDFLFRSGENVVNIGGVKVDCCEDLQLEWPIYGTALARHCAVRQKKLARMEEVCTLTIVWHGSDRDGGRDMMLEAGTPVARIRSGLRNDLDSVRFNAAVQCGGEEAALSFYGRTSHSVRFYSRGEETRGGRR